MAISPSFDSLLRSFTLVARAEFTQQPQRSFANLRFVGQTVESEVTSGEPCMDRSFDGWNRRCRDGSNLGIWRYHRSTKRLMILYFNLMILH